MKNSVRRLVDIHEICELKYRYCEYCDDNYNATGISTLFVRDGVYETAAGLMVRGRDNIRALFESPDARLPFAVHSVGNPIIEIDGDSARASWKLFQPASLDRGRGVEAVWIAGRYSDRYSRVHGEWRFEHVYFEMLFATPFDEGWVKTRHVL